MTLPRSRPEDNGSTFRIRGGQAVAGEVQLSGSKNSGPKLMIAALLTDEPCEFLAMPQLGDVRITEELITELGAQVTWQDHICRVDASHMRTGISQNTLQRNRTSVLALGPLLHRFKKVSLPRVGGDVIGPRPVDFHVQALEAMGATVHVTNAQYEAEAPEGLHGAQITLPYPSVGATETVLLTAVLASGRTMLTNAAIEPEVMDLVAVLQKMGAIIELGSHRSITIEGVVKLHGARHRVIRDRNEAVSFACVALATHGQVFLRGANQADLITFLNTVRRLGADYTVDDEGITILSAPHYRPAGIETDTHPGFMTDWQQPLGVVLTQVEGTSTIHETVHDNRLGYLKDLQSMGADVEISTECIGSHACRYENRGMAHSATIRGVTPLHGAVLTVPDIRAGFAHVIAALVADGESTLQGIHHLDRGYEQLDRRLAALGADITRVSVGAEA